MKNKSQKSKKQTRGQNLIEYTLTLVLIAIAVIVALAFLTNRLAPVFSKLPMPVTSQAR